MLEEYIFHISPYLLRSLFRQQELIMCPKNAAFKVPHNKIRILMKEAKQLVNGPYYCPQCKKELMQILADTKKKEVYAICTCGLEQQLTYAPVFQPVDYYSKFMDMYKRRNWK